MKILKSIIKNKIIIIIGILFVLGSGFALKMSKHNGSIDVEDQIKIFADRVDEWSNVTGYFCFTVADLNQDGRLELIISADEGSGDYPYTQYYIIQDGKQELMQLQEKDRNQCSSDLIYDFLVGKQISDGTHRIVNNGVTYVPVYYDKQNNVYYYIHHNYSGHTPYESRDKVVSLSLETNIISEKLLAYKSATTDEPYGSDRTIVYVDRNENEISEAEYNNIADSLYGDCEKMEMCWKWKRVETKDEVRDMNKKELRELLMDAYENFQMR